MIMRVILAKSNQTSMNDTKLLKYSNYCKIINTSNNVRNGQKIFIGLIQASFY